MNQLPCYNWKQLKSASPFCADFMSRDDISIDLFFDSFSM